MMQTVSDSRGWKAEDATEFLPKGRTQEVRLEWGSWGAERKRPMFRRAKSQDNLTSSLPFAA